MTLTLKHAFTSPKADGVDPTAVKPSDWNNNHGITTDLSSVVLGAPAAGSIVELPLSLTTTGRMQTLGSEGFTVPNGTSAQRPASPRSGEMRFNSTLGDMEYYGLGGYTSWQTPAWRKLASLAPNAVANANIQNIPSRITDLMVLINLQFALAGSNFYMQFYNAAGVLDITAVYYFTALFASGTTSTVGSGSATNAMQIGTNLASPAQAAIIPYTADILIPGIQRTLAQQVRVNAHYDNVTPTLLVSHGVWGRAAAGPVTGIYFSSEGNFTGEIDVLGKT